MTDEVTELEVALYSIGVEFSELNCAYSRIEKRTDVQSGPGMATIFSRAGESGVGIDEACGQEEKKDERLLRDR